MALFGKKLEKKMPSVIVTALPPVVRDVSRVIVRPMITEKAALMGDGNVFVFEVARSATKYDVRDAVRKLWNVVPRRINIVNRVPRQFVIRSKNRKSTERGVKKAYVFLKKGDTIELV